MKNEINEYLKEHAVWCPTLQESEEFMEFVKNEIGLKTVSNGAYKFWKNYEEKTAFANVFNKVGYSPYEWYLTEQGLSIVPFKEFKSKFMEETMNPEKEAQECSEEKWKKEVREIVREEIGNMFKPKGAQSLKINKVPEPAPELTQKENNILKGLHYLGWSWIARDDFGDKPLRAFLNKPSRMDEYWESWGEIEKSAKLDDVAWPFYEDTYYDNFEFITWESEPMLIADLIDWSDDE